jgi:hypothetical protein
MKPDVGQLLVARAVAQVVHQQHVGDGQVGQPAAAMQRTAQREKAFQATMRPNSNSDSSTLRGDTRCDELTMPGALPAGAAARRNGCRRLRGACVASVFSPKR